MWFWYKNDLFIRIKLIQLSATNIENIELTEMINWKEISDEESAKCIYVCMYQNGTKWIFILMLVKNMYKIFGNI